LRDLNEYCRSLTTGGLLFMSGFIAEDKELVLEEVRQSGLSIVAEMRENEWMAICLSK
ncbi:MAG: 50S ribosomal protein L11 methyltransferase, partial [Bacteroidetes bacterium HGW-Bacteroidetes-21]